jgi:hypothetical protein
LEGKADWLNWKSRVCILLRGIPDAMDVVDGILKRPEVPGEGASEAKLTAYQTALNKFSKADCNAMIVMSTNISDETYEKVRTLTNARDVWLELHRLYDEVHEDRAYNLCMQFFSYRMNADDDIATHITKLKNIWKDLKLKLEKHENRGYY